MVIRISGRLVAAVAAAIAVPTLGAVRSAAGQGPPPGVSVAPCTPTEFVEEGKSVGDSVTVGGRQVPRTRAALRSRYPEPRGPFAFYPGERVVIGVGGRRLGTAVYDGCTLVPEWRGPVRIPPFETITSFDVEDPKAAPASLRDPRGYRVLHVTAWKGQRRKPAA